MPPAAPARAQQRSLLPLLGGALAIILLGGIVMASRGGAARTPTTPAAAPTAAPALQATALPASQPTSAPAPPTAAPAPPTALPPQPTAPPPPQPTAAPAAPAAPIDQLRNLLASGIAAGKAGEHGDELLKQLDEAQRALADGDKRRATERLSELAKRLLEGAANGAIEPGFARQALDLVGAVASSNGLTLQLPSPPQEEDKGKGKGKGKDK